MTTFSAPSAVSPRRRAPALLMTGEVTPSLSRAARIWSSAVQWYPGPWAMIATRQAEATTSGRASASSRDARSVWAFIGRSVACMTADQGEGPDNPWPALWALVIGFFMILVDVSIVSIATPALMDSFDAGVEPVLWVTSAYLLAYA